MTKTNRPVGRIKSKRYLIVGFLQVYSELLHDFSSMLDLGHALLVLLLKESQVTSQLNDDVVSLGNLQVEDCITTMDINPSLQFLGWYVKGTGLG